MNAIDTTPTATARRAARALDNRQLATRLETLNDRRLSSDTRATEAMWSPIMKLAFLEEAARRLRWGDAYRAGEPID